MCSLFRIHTQFFRYKNMKYNKVGILGGTGFVGQHLASLLLKQGHQVSILTRNPNKHPTASLLIDVNIQTGDAFDSQTLESFCEGLDVLINLVGILNEKNSDGQEFHHIHVDLAHHAVHACEIKHVPRLLHMSALNADANNGASYYLRSKGEAEDWAHHAAEWGLDVTSFRPSVIFGANDNFLNRFANLLKLTPLAFPLACPNSRFAPVYIDDVCLAFANALNNPDSIGQRYELCGPEIWSLKELVNYTVKNLGLKRIIIGLPDFASRLQARMLGMLPTKPFSMDNYLSLQTDSVCQHDGLSALHIKPTSLKAIAPQYLGNDSHTGHLDNYRQQITYSCKRPPM